MSTGIARRDLLKGRFAPAETAIRPPFAIAEPAFRTACTRCPDCANACATGLIRADRDGYPKMRFVGECSFCGDCRDACRTGALDAAKARPWTVRAQIGDACLAVNGVVCRSCGDPCPANAIRFRLLTGGRAQPIVDAGRCTGCGACAAVCANRSIRMVVGTAAEPKEQRPWAY